MKINIEKYKPEWKREYKKLNTLYKESLGELVLAIEHVGSTSVIGLPSKPILDIDIIVENEEYKEKTIKVLEKLGYIHMGDQGIKGREAFRRKEMRVPYSENNMKWMEHHLYVCTKGIASLENHLRFRDYLRENIEAVEEYGKLKMKLAEMTEDIDEYVEGKSEFISKILEKAGMDIEEVEGIKSQNKVK